MLLFSSLRMEAVKDWLSCQVASAKSLIPARPLSGTFLDDKAAGEESDELGSRLQSGGQANSPADVSSFSLDGRTNEPSPPSQLLVVRDAHLSSNAIDSKKMDPISKVEALKIKFLRLVYGLGQSPQNPVVAQVLYRLHLACLIRAGDSEISREGLKNDKAIAAARDLEIAGCSDLDFSFKILLLGKTGVGKSATINSIFNQSKVEIDAFHPTTNHVHELEGIINGIKITVIDTPGLFPSCQNQRRNRQILLTVKRFIKRSKPDMVLYFERLDLINMGYSDFPLLKLITDILGSTVWFNTILVMTHSASGVPEGDDGYPVSYGGFVSQCTAVVQHYIRQAADDARVENPVLLVDNHPACKTNSRGEKVLPNGQVWKSQFLLLCAASKVLGDTNALLKFQDTFRLRQVASRMPSLPHLLTSLLRPQSGGPIEELVENPDLDEDDEYDQLPPIRILKKSQFERLNKDQQKDYLDELEYRETLYLRKQWKEELRRKRYVQLSADDALANDGIPENDSPQEYVQLPDMTIPLIFDSDCPVYRYRCLVGYNDNLFVRPVLDSQCWDHEIGFDGINLEMSEDLGENLHTSIVGQMSKDKQGFSLQSECTASYTDIRGGPTLSAGFEVQTSGRDVICTTRGDAKLKNMKNNVIGCGVCVTSFGDKCFLGAKLEDSIVVGRRLKFVLNGGRVVGCGQAAHGATIEATLIGRDFPVRNDKTTLALSALSFEKETIFGGSVQSDFRPYRGTSLSFNLSLNSKNMGQVSVKTSSNEHVDLGLIALVSIVRALFWRRNRETLPPALADNRKI